MQLHALLAEGRRLFGPEHLPKDPRDWWTLHHRLEPGTLSRAPRETVLGSDAELYLLQFEYDVTPALNREATDAFEAARELAFDIGGAEEAATVMAPDRPIACRWIPELTQVTDWAIGKLSLPRLDPLTGRATAVDWEAVGAWKCDLVVAARQLTRPQRRVVWLLWEGYDFGEIKRRLGWSWPAVIETIRLANTTLRDWAGKDE